MEKISKKFPGLRALVVDDYIVNQELNRELLQMMECEVEIAENGLVALEMYKNEPFDIVLLDIQMPEMDGYQFTKNVRETEEDSDKHTIIIAITANVFSGEKEKCLNAGMDDYIGKPIRSKNLEEILQQFFEDKMSD